MTTLAPSAPCPRWCDRSPGHGLTTRAGETRRVHLGALSGGMELECVDEVSPTGVVTAGRLVTRDMERAAGVTA